MIQIILVLFLLFNVVTLEGNVSNYENKGLIANGQVYDVEKYPYVVSIVIKICLDSIEEKAICTGSLISEWFVLTAAHCTNNMTISDINIFHGNSHQQIQRIYQHHMYNPITFKADICLLKLRKPFKNVKRYINVAGQPDDFTHGKSLDCVVIGFGITADKSRPDLIGYMTNASVTYGPTACQLSNRSSIIDTWEEYLCSKPDTHMVCPGDSGGPMICNGFLYGIASHGYNFKELNKDFECGSSEIQTRHLFAYSYRKWIANIINIGNSLIPNNNLYFTTIMLVLYIAVNVL